MDTSVEGRSSHATEQAGLKREEFVHHEYFLRDESLGASLFADR